jgi:hypothetical protein
MPVSDDEQALRERVLGFVRGLGIAVRDARPGEEGFLPGLAIRCGAIVVNAARWEHPGDLLHEAGHLAVITPEERIVKSLAPTPADEMAAIAWSYAAAVHLGVAARTLFHDAYKAGGESLAENFANGCYFGTPMLAYYRMTIEPRRASSDGPPPYPHMLRWLR